MNLMNHVFISHDIFLKVCCRLRFILLDTSAKRDDMSYRLQTFSAVEKANNEDWAHRPKI